ncbi:MAG: putative toxin-antitoxin system toxin component, PIN family [Oscillospiraceae bacterium]|nr:putative toxin-antitoxin system toxin component, PIN family [Oscillospiraceae bacterium]
MQIYAVVDTNVIVSALITKNPQSPPNLVLREMLDGKIIPLYHADIIEEYREVLSRTKFHLKEETIQKVINSIISNGIEVNPTPTGEILIDMDDLVFYEVAMEKRDDDAYLVTGNQKHYPVKDFIVTPSEMLSILNQTE